MMLMTYHQHILCQMLIFIRCHILFPKNEGINICGCQKFYLFQKIPVTEMSVGHCHHMGIALTRHRYTHSAQAEAPDP